VTKNYRSPSIALMEWRYMLGSQLNCLRSKSETNVLKLAKEKFSCKYKLEEISRTLYCSCSQQCFGRVLITPATEHVWKLKIDGVC